MRKTHNSSNFDIELEQYKEILTECGTPKPTLNDKFHENFQSSHSKFVFDKP